MTVAKGAGNLISKLTGIRGGLLGITGAIGNWLTKVTGAVEKTGAFLPGLQKTMVYGKQAPWL